MYIPLASIFKTEFLLYIRFTDFVCLSPQTPIIFVNSVLQRLPQLRAVCEVMWNNIAERGRTHKQYKTLHAHCMLDTQGYKHTLRICNIYCFSPAAAGYPNAYQQYEIRTLPVLFIFCHLAYRVKLAVARSIERPNTKRNVGGK